MAEENVFGDQAEKVENQESNSGSSSLFVVGEREYDVESARKKIENADEHIRRIEEENAQMREELQKAKTLDDVLKAMNTNTPGTQNQTNSPSTEDVASLVERMLTNSKQEEIATRNLEIADKEIKKIYGEKAKDMFQSKAQELGLGVKTLTELAAKSPTAFLKLFDNRTQDQVASSNKGTQSNLSIPDGEPKQGTYAYYQKMRKDNPSLYSSAKVQQKMMEDADRLGKEAFFS